MMMRLLAGLLALAALTAPAWAQSPSPAPAPALAAAGCMPQDANLGGIGRAKVIRFRGPVFGGSVCAVVATVGFDAFTARVAGATAGDALIAASLTPGGGVTLPLDGATVTDAGPYVIAPGGVIPGFGADTSEVPRVIVAFSGAHVIVIGTSPAALADVARILRLEPGLFDADAIERAVVVASGPGAAVALHTRDGTLGREPATPQVLLFMKRG